MIRETAEAVRPARLPTCDVPIRVRRDRSKLLVAEAEIHVVPAPRLDDCCGHVRWNVVDPLLPDETILIYGRSIEWTGPVSKHSRGLKLVENLFPQPIMLSRDRPRLLTGPVHVAFPPDLEQVGWNFGAVLVRGDDPPWVTSAILRIVRDRT